MPLPLFDLHAAGFATPGRVLLHPTTLQLRPTGVTGLIGHNGSGKTTLLRLLARQLAPTTGHLRFNGQDLRTWSRRDFARHLAYMPQNPTLDPSMRVRDLVALGRFPWHGTLGRMTDTDRAATATALQQTGTDTLADRPVGQLSGGERQRAVIAMCVAQGSHCLLLDEPTSALDVAHQVQVLATLRTLSRDAGLAILVVLHDINLAARFCDELLALRAGQLIARGSPATLMSEDSLHAIYGTRLGVLPHPAGLAPVAFIP